MFPLSTTSQSCGSVSAQAGRFLRLQVFVISHEMSPLSHTATAIAELFAPYGVYELLGRSAGAQPSEDPAKCLWYTWKDMMITGDFCQFAVCCSRMSQNEQCTGTSGGPWLCESLPVASRHHGNDHSLLCPHACESTHCEHFLGFHRGKLTRE